MLRFLKGFFGKPTPPDVTPKPEPVAPYKVESPVVEIAPTPTPLVPEVVKTSAKKAPAKKKPAAMKAPAKSRAPAKPRTPK